MDETRAAGAGAVPVNETWLYSISTFSPRLMPESAARRLSCSDATTDQIAILRSWLLESCAGGTGVDCCQQSCHFGLFVLQIVFCPV